MLEKIKELRQITSLPLNECKQALLDSSGDVKLATELLQKKGFKFKQDVQTSEGVVSTAIGGNPLGKWASILEMRCQTDFAANSKLMDEEVQSALGTVGRSLTNFPFYYEFLSNQLKEQCSIVRGERVIAGENEWCETYTHHNKKIAAIIVMNGFDEFAYHHSKDDEKAYYCDHYVAVAVVEFANQLMFNIVGTNPTYLNVSDIPASVTLKQSEIFKAQIESDGKAKNDKMIEKMMEGKFKKWYSEVVLLKQESLIHPKKTIEVLLKELSVTVGFEVKISKFVRYQLGESK